MTVDVRDDPLTSALLDRASEPFRKIASAVVGEIRHGDINKAGDLVAALMMKRMAPIDRRCMLALQVSVQALAGLHSAGLRDGFDIRHLLGTSVTHHDFANANAAAFGYGPIIREAFQAEADEDVPCPNCGGEGPVVGWARPTTEDGVAHARIYLDLPKLIGGPLARLDFNYRQAQALGTIVLGEPSIRLPIRQCGRCELRFVARRIDADRLAAAYAASTGGGFDLDGRTASGRAHALGFAYVKAALPLHLNATVGDLRGLSLYDFGCAEGVMAAVLRNLGAVVSGGDLDAPKVHYARRALGLSELTDDPAAFWSVPLASLDGVIAFHTLEHTIEPDRYLARFREMLRPGGCLAVSVPRTAVGDDGKVLDMGGSHLIGFDHDILASFLARHGFQEIDSQVDDGAVAPDRLDPLLHLPAWSGRPGDVTVIARRS